MGDRSNRIGGWPLQLFRTMGRVHNKAGDIVPFHLKAPTLGGKQFWMDRHIHAGHRIQQHIYTRHHRLLDPKGMRLSYGEYEHCYEHLQQCRSRQDIAPPPGHMVLMIHGITRSAGMFNAMRPAIAKAGYDAAPISYPSTRRTIGTHACALENLIESLEGTREISFVTQSMGALVLRTMLARKGTWMKRIKLRRIVMIVPPSQGADLARMLRNLPPYKFLYGVSGQELTPTQAFKIPPLTHPFGIIAGGRGQKRGYSPLLRGDNDGIVRVKESRLAGADDFLLVQTLHSLAAANPEVIKATTHYLTTGYFDHGKAQ